MPRRLQPQHSEANNVGIARQEGSQARIKHARPEICAGGPRHGRLWETAWRANSWAVSSHNTTGQNQSWAGCFKANCPTHPGLLPFVLSNRGLLGRDTHGGMEASCQAQAHGPLGSSVQSTRHCGQGPEKNPHGTSGCFVCFFAGRVVVQV